jgi:hypothetical protein
VLNGGFLSMVPDYVDPPMFDITTSIHTVEFDTSTMVPTHINGRINLTVIIPIGH